MMPLTVGILFASGPADQRHVVLSIELGRRRESSVLQHCTEKRMRNRYMSASGVKPLAKISGYMSQ